jgi:hypothetical protein
MDEIAETNDGPVDESAAEMGGYTKPAGSAITIERFPDGVTIQVPPAGLWQGSHGLFAFALIWLAITVPICLCVGGGIIAGQDNAQGNKAMIWLLPLMMLLFPLVGIGLLLAAINMGRRKAALAVTGGSLMVLQTGLFGSKQREWPPGEVEAVRAGPSGMTVNDKPVLELQIFDGGAEKFGLLAGRTNEELEWMARELREVLKVRARA